MRPYVPYDVERHEALEALEAAFGADAFRSAYPGFEPPDAVTIGGDASRPSCQVYVAPFPESVTNERRVACPGLTTSFDLEVYAVASGATVEAASAACLAYVDCIQQALMAAPALGGASPRLERSGVDYDGSFGYVAAAVVGLRVTSDVKPNRRLARAARAGARTEG